MTQEHVECAGSKARGVLDMPRLPEPQADVSAGLEVGSPPLRVFGGSQGSVLSVSSLLWKPNMARVVTT